MAAFFGNLRNVVIAGFALAIGVAAIYVGCLKGSIDAAFWLFVTRWLHAGRIVLRNAQRMKILLDPSVILIATDAANREDHR